MSDGSNKQQHVLRICPSRARRQAACLLGLGLTCILGFAQPGKVLPAALREAGRLVSLETNTASGTVSDAALAAQLQGRLAEARLEAGQAGAVSDRGTNVPAGATAGEAIEYRHLVQGLPRVYQQHLEDLEALQAIRRRQQDLELAMKSWAGFSEAPPYSIRLVDNLRDTVHSLNAKIEAGGTGREVLDKLLAEAKAQMDETDRRLRLITEQLESTRDGPTLTQLTWQRALEQARARMAAAYAARYETRRRRVDAEFAERRQSLAFAQRQLGVAVQRVRFYRADLDQVLNGLDAEERGLEREHRSAEADNEARQKALAQAREELRQALEAPPAPLAEAAARADRLRSLQERLEVQSAEAETSASRLTMLRQLEEFVGYQRAMWEMRFAAFGTHDLTTLLEAYRRLDRLSNLVRAGKVFFSQQVELAAGMVSAQQDRLQSRADGPAGSAPAQALLETYRQREDIYRRALGSLDQVERLLRLWKDSMDLDRRALPFTARVRDLFTGSAHVLSRLWQFELFTAEDTITVDGERITGRRAITVGKIIKVILILVVGLWVSNLAAKLVERVAVKRLKAEPNQANLIRRWTRVGLVACLIIFSLVSVKIPLTVFAFLGGALAIGLGFGTQTLLKNFISGIMILFERPFRVGDVLDVGGQRGVVTSIGTRSSVLELFDGTETLIPNSTLLETNLTNWTYSNHRVRFSIKAGVAYGTDTRKVAQLLKEEADRHGLVEKEPAPQALFQDFGDSTLAFELRYFVDVQRHNAAQVASDLRHMISGTFAEHGIVMAFPQRDVHFDITRPVPVAIIPPPKSE